jgi:hypothetical protein
MPPAHASGTDERDGAAQFKTEWAGQRTSFAEVAREPRDNAATGGYTGVEVDELGSDASRDRVNRLADRLEVSRLAQRGPKLLVLSVFAAEIPNPPVINVGRAKLSTHIPHDNVVAAQNRTLSLYDF